MFPARAALGVAILLVALGCSPRAPEPYVRVSGAAPILEDAPPARALLLTFWATFCPGCREEADALRALTQQLPADLAVVVVSEDKDLATVAAFFGGSIPPALHLRLDDDWRIAHSLRLDQLPTSVLVVDGAAVARFDGAREWGSANVRATLTRLIGSTGAKP